MGHPGAVAVLGITIFASSSYVLYSAGGPTPFFKQWMLRGLGMLIAWFGANVFVVGMSMYFQTPGVFGKNRKTGQLPFWARLLHSPWFAFTRLMIQGKRKKVSRLSPPVPVLSPIKTTKFWLGGWPDKKTTEQMDDCP